MRRQTGIARALGTSCDEGEMNERNRSNKRNQQHQKTGGLIISHFYMYYPLQVEISDDIKTTDIVKATQDN